MFMEIKAWTSIGISSKNGDWGLLLETYIIIESFICINKPKVRSGLCVGLWLVWRITIGQPHDGDGISV